MCVSLWTRKQAGEAWSPRPLVAQAEGLECLTALCLFLKKSNNDFQEKRQEKECEVYRYSNGIRLC